MIDSNRLLHLTDFTIELHRAESFEQLGSITIDALRALINCDRADLILASSLLPFVRHAAMPETVDDARYRDLTAALSAHDPIYVNRLRLLVDRPTWTGEYFSAEQLRRSPLYHEVWRPQRIRYQLDFPTPDRLGFDITVARERGRDFDLGDATVMHVLARHLEAATEALIAANDDRLPVNGTLVPVQRFTWLVCDDRGTVLRSMPRALQQMRILAGPGAPATQLPPILLTALHDRMKGAPSTSIQFRSHGRDVSAHVAPIRGAAGEWSVGFLEHPQPNDPLRALVRLGLTRREAEVLHWIMQGKSNGDLATILGISVLTAKKHVENLLRKLNVETRTAAVRCGHDAIAARRRLN